MEIKIDKDTLAVKQNYKCLHYLCLRCLAKKFCTSNKENNDIEKYVTLKFHGVFC